MWSIRAPRFTLTLITTITILTQILIDIHHSSSFILEVLNSSTIPTGMRVASTMFKSPNLFATLHHQTTIMCQSPKVIVAPAELPRDDADPVPRKTRTIACRMRRRIKNSKRATSQRRCSMPKPNLPSSSVPGLGGFTCHLLVFEHSNRLLRATRPVRNTKHLRRTSFKVGACSRDVS